MAVRMEKGYTAALHIARLHAVACDPAERLPVVRLRLHQLMKTRGVSAYALSKATGLTYPSAYRLSRPGGAFGRLHADTLDSLCAFFGVQPGALLVWVPAKRRR
jgi:DNA-binding Xre family transcriptional regulator